MLSDHERETLRDIQRRLATDDPDLARKLDRADGRGKPGPSKAACLSAMIASLFFMFVLLGAQSPFGTLVFLAAAAVSGGLYYRAAHRTGPS